MEQINRRRFLKYLTALVFISFAFHYLWENLQCEPFFNMPGKVNYMPWLMIKASLADVFITLVTYFIIAFYSKSFNWIVGKWSKAQWSIILVSAVLFSVVFELVAKKFNMWSYTPDTPVVPGLRISIIPILQLFIIFPLSFRITRFLLA